MKALEIPISEMVFCWNGYWIAARHDSNIKRTLRYVDMALEAGTKGKIGPYPKSTSRKKRSPTI
jgi:hypothetical protein